MSVGRITQDAVIEGRHSFQVKSWLLFLAVEKKRLAVRRKPKLTLKVIMKAHLSETRETVCAATGYPGKLDMTPFLNK